MTNTDFSKVERLARSFSYKVYRRLVSAGVRCLSVDDIFQESVIAYCGARDNYSEDRDVPFHLYFLKGMKNHLNRWADEMIKNQGGSTISIQTKIGEDSELHEILISDKDNQEDILIRNDTYNYHCDQLSPRAKQFVDFINEPPVQLYKQLDILRLKSEYFRARGINCSALKQINRSIIFDLMGADMLERNAIRKEIAGIVGRELI